MATKTFTFTVELDSEFFETNIQGKTLQMDFRKIHPSWHPVWIKYGWQKFHNDHANRAGKDGTKEVKIAEAEKRLKEMESEYKGRTRKVADPLGNLRTFVRRVMETLEPITSSDRFKEAKKASERREVLDTIFDEQDEATQAAITAEAQKLFDAFNKKASGIAVKV